MLAQQVIRYVPSASDFRTASPTNATTRIPRPTDFRRIHSFLSTPTCSGLLSSEVVLRRADVDSNRWQAQAGRGTFDPCSFFSDVYDMAAYGTWTRKPWTGLPASCCCNLCKTYHRPLAHLQLANQALFTSWYHFSHPLNYLKGVL